MFAVPHLRQFITERLTSAAEEIFFVFEKTIIEYEQQIDHQRRLLDEVYKPEGHLQRIEHVCEDQDQQQVCVQIRNSSLDQEDPEPAQIKEEEEEYFISEEGEQLVLKQETDDFLVDAAHEESDNSEEPTLNFTIEEIASLAEERTSSCVPVQISVVPEANSDQQLVSHNSDEAENQDQRGGKHASTSTTAEPEQNSYNTPQYNHTMSAVHCDPHTGPTPFVCHLCGEAFPYKSSLRTHITKHTGERPFRCKICGNSFRVKGTLENHMRTHTDERPFACKTCGKTFRRNAHLTDHMRTHTDEKPFPCPICGKDFRCTSNLKKHIKTHTSEKLQHCGTKVQFVFTPTQG